MCRVWTPSGARYIGFLGQPRSLQYETKQRRRQSSSAPVEAISLPHDITEGPVGPLKTASAMRRHLADRQGGLTCPLVFDNTRWRTKRPVSRLKRQSSKLSTIGREASFVRSPAKKKFFDALLKRSVNREFFYIARTSSRQRILRDFNRSVVGYMTELFLI